MKGFAFLLLLLCAGAHADTVRITTPAGLSKYAGAVSSFAPPSATNGAAVLYFTQGSDMPIGGGPPAPPLAGSFRWSVVWTYPTGKTTVLRCMGPVPAFAHNAFAFHLTCDRQP